MAVDHKKNTIEPQQVSPGKQRREFTNNLPSFHCVSIAVFWAQEQAGLRFTRWSSERRELQFSYVERPSPMKMHNQKHHFDLAVLSAELSLALFRGCSSTSLVYRSQSYSEQICWPPECIPTAQSECRSLGRVENPIHTSNIR